MPLRKKNTVRNKVIMWTLIIILLILMIIYFPPTQHVTEVILYQ